MNEIAQLKLDEGFSSTLYVCTAGKQSIGYGFNLDDVGMSEYEADVLLTIRVNKLSRDLKKKIPWLACAPPEVRGVLLNMAYQMGLSGLLEFKHTLRYLRSEEYGLAAMEMINSRWFTQTPERAKRLADRIHKLQKINVHY